jgi:hypothetical protein
VHPYFDVVDDAIWLKARVVEVSPPIVTFFADPPYVWDPIRRARVETHFETFGLATLYTTHAGAELVNVYVDLLDAEGLRDPLILKSHFLETARKRRLPVRNSWQAALYRALADSDWFREGGWLEIAKSELLS